MPWIALAAVAALAALAWRQTHGPSFETQPGILASPNAILPGTWYRVTATVAMTDRDLARFGLRSYLNVAGLSSVQILTTSLNPPWTVVAVGQAGAGANLTPVAAVGPVTITKVEELSPP